MKPLKLLLIDSAAATNHSLLKKQLKEIPNIKFNLELAQNFEVGKRELIASNYDIYLIQEKQREQSGIALLKAARAEGIDKPLIILNASADRQKDMIAMEAGADDYIVATKMSAENIERSVRYSFERYKSRLRIEQRELRYRNLFERSIDAIAITDEALNITEVNQSFAQLLKLSTEKMIGHNIDEYFRNEEQSKDFKQQVDTKGLLKKYEAQLLREDGQKIYCEITTVALFDLNHKVSGYQLIINDLTQVQKEKQKAMRAEKLGMTGRLARGIAHEVRNPLTNINLSMDHIKEELKDRDGLSTYLNIIERSSERIDDLIDSLLSSSKPSQLKIEMNSINDLIEESLMLAKDRIKLKNIKLKVSLGKDIQLPFDFDNLKTAMLNILINAIEAMEDNVGELCISKKLSIDEVNIDISDNGVGIDQDTLKMMFDPFFTGKNTGMGLGLTSTQNIIQQHGGSIDVESEKDEGTTFVICLPKHKTNNQ